MKRILIIISLIVFPSIACAGQHVRMTYFHVPPHIIYDPSTRKISGAVFDLITDLAPEWGVTVQWDDVPSNLLRQKSMLQRGEKDAAAVLICDPANFGKFAYSKEAYHYARNAILVRKENPLSKITKIDDICSLDIGYAAKAYVSAFMRDECIKWEFVYTTNIKELNLRKVLAGRIDATYAPDHTAFIFEMKMANAQEKVKLLYTPEPPAPFHIGFSHKKPMIKEKFDAAFAKMNGAKKYAEFLSAYTGKSD